MLTRERQYVKPVNNGVALGTSYLGSEYDYIIQSGVAAYEFGQSGSISIGTWCLTLTPSRSLTATTIPKRTVYAAPEKGYGIGYTQNATDENGLPGTYSITGVTEGFDVSLTGQFYVDTTMTWKAA